MSEITILHMSDIHFRKTKNEETNIYRQAVREKLIEAVKAHSLEHGNPDFVAIAGDIAFSGQKHEYDEALVFLDQLKSILPESTSFLVVPGNHDVDRDQVSKFLSLHRIVEEGKTDMFLESGEEVKSFINVKFKSYRAFVDRLNPSLYDSEDGYFWVKNVEDKNVSFLGLNSAWASEGDDDRFHIALGYPQLMEALGRSRFPNRIVLMHHPPFNWLKDLQAEKYLEDLLKNAKLLLHGHNHADNALVLNDPVRGCICLGANASYTTGKDGFIGFQFVNVDFLEKTTRVRVWPYILEERHNEFISDRNRWPGPEGRAYFDIETVARIDAPAFPATISLERQKLPLGLQTFRDLIIGDYLYVDKTRHIYSFFKGGGKYYFLSRPRRFGKSLLVSTLKEIFSGNKELFKGLWIYDHIPWEKYPVIHIDFLGLNYGNKKELLETIDFIIDENARFYGIRLREKSYDKKFKELVKELSNVNKVVILIDEYDKPIIDYIDKKKIALENKEILRNFYSTIKGLDQYLRFAFITGVSKFSRVSVFSGLNNLRDITLADEFATILGYTEEEMGVYFYKEIMRLAVVLSRKREEIVARVKDWYNGYSWDGKNFLYNPFSILSLFQEDQFGNYWFSSATPTFLIKFIRESGRDIREYDELKTSGYLFDQYDVDNIDVVSLLFQTGYLTVKERRILPSSKLEYILSYPNTEVRESFLVYLFKSFTTPGKILPRLKGF